VLLVIHSLGINHLFGLRVDLVDAEIDVDPVETPKINVISLFTYKQA